MGRNENNMTLQEIVDNIPVGELINKDDDIFWYKTRSGNERYKHENGKVGDIFYDGNNGDKWKVLAINTQLKRAIVENKTQHGKLIVFWND